MSILHKMALMASWLYIVINCCDQGRSQVSLKVLELSVKPEGKTQLLYGTISRAAAWKLRSFFHANPNLPRDSNLPDLVSLTHAMRQCRATARHFHAYFSITGLKSFPYSIRFHGNAKIFSLFSISSQGRIVGRPINALLECGLKAERKSNRDEGSHFTYSCLRAMCKS